MLCGRPRLSQRKLDGVKGPWSQISGQTLNFEATVAICCLGAMWFVVQKTGGMPVGTPCIQILFRTKQDLDSMARANHAIASEMAKNNFD